MECSLELVETQRTVEQNTKKQLRKLRDQDRKKIELQELHIANLQRQLDSYRAKSKSDSKAHDSELEERRTKFLRSLHEQPAPSEPLPPSTRNEYLSSQLSGLLTPASEAIFTGDTSPDTKDTMEFCKLEDMNCFDGDFKHWSIWRNHLEMVLEKNKSNLKPEAVRVKLIRNYCTSTALDLIAAETNPSNPGYRYVTTNSVLAHLEYVFGSDGLARAVECHNKLPGSALRFRSSETFETFLSRFTAVTAPLQLQDWQKLYHLRMQSLLNVPFDVVYCDGVATYRQLVEHLQKWDTDRRLAKSSAEWSLSFPRWARDVVGIYPPAWPCGDSQ
ncbi:MAG: hypothetical protein MMC33_009035 [Icmadophila ericetorum]|nr:hypothetical protein [Icmadophila ericetorum]